MYNLIHLPNILQIDHFVLKNNEDADELQKRNENLSVSRAVNPPQNKNCQPLLDWTIPA